MGIGKSFENLPKQWRLSDRPLVAQFLAAGGVVAVFTLLSLAVLLARINQQAEASRWLTQTHKTIDLLSSLASISYRQQLEIHHFLETKDERYLAKSREQKQLWDEEVEAIEKLILDAAARDPSDQQLERLRKLKDGYQSWQGLTDRMIFQLASQLGSTPRPLDATLLREEGALFKDAYDQINRLIEKEKALVEVRDRNEKRSIEITTYVVAIFNVALMIVFGIVLARLYIAIARPIADLSKATRRYEGGDFTTRVPVSNRSEIGILQASFNEMAEKIEAMVADLRKLDELKTDFLSTVSHELRTPLTSITGYVKLLLAGDAGGVTETQKEFLAIIDTNVTRLTHLINDILDVEKMASGKVQMTREKQDLADVLRECKTTFEVVAKQKGLELRFAVPSQPIPVYGDRARLVQIFMNLVSNAIKYTKSGYVEIRAESHEYAVKVRVIDTGIGMTDADRGRIFEKFFRAKTALTSLEGGTGLGLVIAKGFVEAHGGAIAMESRPDGGSIFSVTLPLYRSSMLDEAPEPVLAPSRLRKIWILDPAENEARQLARLIEESPDIAPMIQVPIQIFRSLNEIPKLASPLDAPALVVLDPVVGQGERRAISILREKLRQTVPVLVIGSAPDIAAAFAEGAMATLQKPIHKEKFLNAVEDLLSRKWGRILIADDNTDLRLLMKRALVQRGFQVDDVERGNLVLGRLENESYDLALIDINFPDVSGTEVLKIIRRIPRFVDLPIFIMAEDYKDMPTESELESWGANRFIAKYAGISGMVDSVCQFFEGRKPPGEVG